MSGLAPVTVEHDIHSMRAMHRSYAPNHDIAQKNSETVGARLRPIFMFRQAFTEPHTNTVKGGASDDATFRLTPFAYDRILPGNQAHFG